MEVQTLQSVLNMYREYRVALKMLMGEHQDRIQAFGEETREVQLEVQQAESEFTILLEDQEIPKLQSEVLWKEFWLFSQRCEQRILKLDLFLKKMEGEMSLLEEEEEEIHYLLLRVARIENH
ncbi:hypothetical protein M0R45_017178 [Rubus argutus]|uniref:Uncharacterized protein n=1 Tax=Rubus argutus TaxID=59490 RepID=A0AAW1XVN4_RUBAR